MLKAEVRMGLVEKFVKRELVRVGVGMRANEMVKDVKGSDVFTRVVLVDSYFVLPSEGMLGCNIAELGEFKFNEGVGEVLKKLG